MRRPRNRLHPFLIAISVYVVLGIVYVIGMAAAQSHNHRFYEFGDLIVPRAVEVLIFSWFLWIGAAIGSFLNVVAWRMPQGLTLGGRSFCPRCRTVLRARDNFPILGWLALRGRCRTCRLPISARYPIVEALVGATLTMICVAELFNLNLPHLTARGSRGYVGLSLHTSAIPTAIYHVVAVSCSWAMGLIRFDAHLLPRRLIGFGLAATIIPILAYPDVMVVPWQFTVAASWSPHGHYLDAIARVFSGLTAAVFLARSLSKGLCPNADLKLDPLGTGSARLLDLMAILAIPMLIVGWQAAAAVTVLAAGIAAAIGWQQRFARRDVTEALGRFAIAMPLATTFQCGFWKQLHDFLLWPSDGSPPWVILVWAGWALTIPLWLNDRRETFALKEKTEANEAAECE